MVMMLMVDPRVVEPGNCASPAELSNSVENVVDLGDLEKIYGGPLNRVPLMKAETPLGCLRAEKNYYTGRG